MQAIKMVNLGLAFLLELCALAALGYWGFRTGSGLPVKAVLGVGAPLAAAVLWGMFAAPKATFEVGEPLQWLVKGLVLGGAAILLYVAGKHSLSVGFLLAILLNQVLMYMWDQ